jgi:RNA polymerase sigma-70 factor (sigma-E family)
MRAFEQRLATSDFAESRVLVPCRGAAGCGVQLCRCDDVTTGRIVSALTQPIVAPLAPMSWDTREAQMGDAADAEYVEFVSSRLPKLRRAAYLLCGDWTRGDDIVSRTLTDVYVHWAKARRADNLDAYIRTVMVHRFIDEQRRGWSRVRLVDTLPDRPNHEPADAATGLDLKAALARMPPRQRAVLVLRFLCDMSVEQTAAALGCSTGTVKSQTSNALASMRSLLAPTELEMT